jgi:hypothetical protein
MDVALAPGNDSWPGDPKPLGDLGIRHAFGRQQQDLGPLGHHGRHLRRV